MNKSDIMKAAEEAAKGWNYNSDIETGRLALVAAAELLKQVEVLPEGSEPQEGDLVRFRRYGYTKIFYGGFDESEPIENIEIIQRAGKPVIIEKEGV